MSADLFAYYTEVEIFADRIMNVMNKSGIKNERDIIMKGVALLYTESMKYDESLAAFKEVKKQNEIIPAALNMVKVLIDRGQLEYAIKVAEMSPNGIREEMLVNIASEYVSIGKNDKAVNVLEMCEVSAKKEKDGYAKAKLLSIISREYSRMGNMSKTLDNISQALWAAEGLKNGKKKIFALSEVAITYMRMDNRILSSILENQIAGINDCSALVDVSEKFIDEYELKTAKKMLDTALKRSSKIENLPEKVNIMYEIAKNYKRLKEFKKAVEVAQEALIEAKRIVSRNSRIDALLRINTILGDDKVYQYALDDILMIQDYNKRLFKLMDIAEGYMSSGSREKGFFVSNMIIEEAKKQKKDKNLNEILKNTERLYVEYGTTEKCGDFIKTLKKNFSSQTALISDMLLVNGRYEDAMFYAKKINNEMEKLLMCAKIADKTLMTLESALKNKVVGEAFYEISTAKSQYFKCICLTEIGISCAREGFRLDRTLLNTLEKI